MAMLTEERERLLSLLAVQEQLKKEREVLMAACWEVDADEIWRAFTRKITVDQTQLVNIMANRTSWHLQKISEIYEKKYSLSLLQQLVNDLTTLIGGIFSGSVTELCTLLTYRLLPQAERDAAFLRDFTDGYLYLNDDCFVEIVATRSNEQLRGAMEEFAEAYGKKLHDVVIAKTSNKHYRGLLLKLLECKRDEEYVPFDKARAEELASELYEAGPGRVRAVDPAPYIRVFGTINHVQFESLNRCYKDQLLLKDIGVKFSAEFERTAAARCTDKYEFLALRLESFFKSYGSNKAAICRILGSLSRGECAEVRKCFDRRSGPVPGKSKSLEAVLTSCVRDRHYLRACLLLVAGDPAQSPMGSDREEGEDEAEVEMDGERARKQAIEAYTAKKGVDKGKEVVRSKKKLRKSAAAQKAKKERGGGVEEGKKDPGRREESKRLDEMDDEEMPQFSWDGADRFLDRERLKLVLKEAKAARKAMVGYRQRLEDELAGVKESYFALVKLCFETETWHRLLRCHITSLTDFSRRRGAAGAGDRALVRSGSSGSITSSGGGSRSGSSSGYESGGSRQRGSAQTASGPFTLAATAPAVGKDKKTGGGDSKELNTDGDSALARFRRSRSKQKEGVEERDVSRSPSPAVVPQVAVAVAVRTKNSQGRHEKKDDEHTSRAGAGRKGQKGRSGEDEDEEEEEGEVEGEGEVEERKATAASKGRRSKAHVKVKRKTRVDSDDDT